MNLSVYAENGDEQGFDPSICLGFDLETVFETCGVPSMVYPVRGEEAWQDDVVFRYGTDYSLFLFRDRVWQVRIWESGSLGGVEIGDSKEKVLTALGPPFAEVEGSWIYNIPDPRCPVRLRLCFSEDIVSDLYLYRSDF